MGEELGGHIVSGHVDAVARIVSRLCLLECRVKPLRDHRDDVLVMYDRFFASAGLTVAEVDARVIDRATQLRAEHRFSTPDAIHLATAVEHEADVMITGDRDFARFQTIPIQIIRP